MNEQLQGSRRKQHVCIRAMLMWKKQRGDDITKYAPIAKTLLTIDESTEVTLKRKFDIAYFIAKE